MAAAPSLASGGFSRSSVAVPTRWAARRAWASSARPTRPGPTYPATERTYPAPVRPTRPLNEPTRPAARTTAARMTSA